MGKRISIAVAAVIVIGTACGPGYTTGVESGESSESTEAHGATGIPDTGGEGVDASEGDDGWCSQGRCTPPMDLPTCGVTCDPFVLDDCPRGEKCTATSCEIGSATWDSNACVAIMGSAQPGEPCEFFGDEKNGLDDCVNGSVCWNADRATGLGDCVSFCAGSAFAPECPGPDQVCGVFNGGVLPLCLPTCDPLMLDCPEAGQVCIPHPSELAFWCTPAAASGTAAYGQPCELSNGCDPGLACISADAVGAAECVNAVGCCGAVCDLSTTIPCPAAAQGEACVPYFDPAPAGYEDVGICVIP